MNGPCPDPDSYRDGVGFFIMKVPPKKEEIQPLTQEDFYWENGFMVFTEAYHKKRGYCCQSGCRHCPYGFRKPAPSHRD